MNLYFCGMIGSGKTTLGSQLAKRLELPFLDLDREMDSRLGYSFHRLVAEQGWLAFRELEYSICRYFAAQDHTIVCLGGGTVRYEWNNDAIRGTGPVVLLEVSTEELIRRVSVADRPRVNPGTDLADDVRMMWEQHAHKYRAAASLSYRAEGKSIGQELGELEAMVRSDPAFRGVLP